MNQVKVYLIIWLCLFGTEAPSFGQQYPKVGESTINYTFSDIDNSKNDSFEIAAAKGEWLVIDFWSASCISCIKSFPHINDLYLQFKDRVNFLAVGLYQNKNIASGLSQEAQIKNIFRYHKERHKLKFPVAYDSVALKVFDVFAVPTILVVNPKGIIVAKTISLNSSDLQSFLDGNLPKLTYAYSASEPRQAQTFDYMKPLLWQVKGTNVIDSNSLSQSILMKWADNFTLQFYTYGWEPSPHDARPKNFAEAIGVDLATLFRIARYGKASWSYQDFGFAKRSMDVLFELNAASTADIQNNLYAYSVILAAEEADAKKFRHKLLDDLQNYWGYRSTIEARKRPAYILKVIDQKKVARLKSKGGTPGIWQWKKARGFDFINQPISVLLNSTGISVGLEGLYAKKGLNVPPIIDTSGINFNIDLKYSGDVVDFENTLGVLHRNGFDLVLTEVDMDCIVVKTIE